MYYPGLSLGSLTEDELYAIHMATLSAKKILENHNPKPLREEVCAKIRSIITETENELGVSKKGSFAF